MKVGKIGRFRSSIRFYGKDSYQKKSSVKTQIQASDATFSENSANQSSVSKNEKIYRHRVMRDAQRFSGEYQTVSNPKAGFLGSNLSTYTKTLLKS